MSRTSFGQCDNDLDFDLLRSISPMKFDFRMHLVLMECRIPSVGHCDLDLWPQ